MAMDEEWLNATQVAKMLELSPSAVRIKAQRRLIPCFKLGRRYRFRASDIEAWAKDKGAASITSLLAKREVSR